MAQRYPSNQSLLDIGLIDGILLIAALSLPFCVLSRLGVDWCTGPEDQ